MEIIILARKGKHLNALERYHIYKVSRENLGMNDTHIDTYNPIFETLHGIYTSKQNTHPHSPPTLTTKTQYKYRKQGLYTYITSSRTIEGAPCADEGATYTPKMGE
jgi:hypothetical protein